MTQSKILVRDPFAPSVSQEVGGVFLCVPGDGVARDRKDLAMQKEEKVLVLRTCDKDRKSCGGFLWPESGLVACDDWRDDERCGGGLHGLLWGEGDGALLDWSPEAVWIVWETVANDVRNLGEKIKAPKGVVVFCGDRMGASQYMRDNGGEGRCIAGGTATAGVGGTATVGYLGTATAGYRGTATAGYLGVIIIYNWAGDRLLPVVGVVDNENLKANTAYQLNAAGDFIESPTA